MTEQANENELASDAISVSLKLPLDFSHGIASRIRLLAFVASIPKQTQAAAHGTYTQATGSQEPLEHFVLIFRFRLDKNWTIVLFDLLVPLPAATVFVG